MRRLILTAAFGGHERIAAITSSTFKAYAKRVGAELHVLWGDKLRATFPSPHWAKTVVSQALTEGGFDEVAWIDSDAIISPSAPDIFETASGRFAAYPESDRLERLINFRDYRIILYGGQSELANRDVLKYYNSGVMVIPKSCAEVLAMPPARELEITRNLRASDPSKYFHDQDWINSRLLLFNVEPVNLPLSFNFMPFEDVWEERHKAAIIHYAGKYAALGNGLLEVITNDLRKWGVEYGKGY